MHNVARTLQRYIILEHKENTTATTAAPSSPVKVSHNDVQHQQGPQG